ncbi:MAG: hypothetical protein Q9227_008615 [Pyrenula ochraceoflavens]
MSSDASKFLAQSQSRLSFAGGERNNDRGRRPTQSGWRSSAASRPYLHRVGNPYQTSESQASHFPFASRLRQQQQAPLFYSATDEFREENDEEEHEREVADMYALQRSRRQIGGGLDESSELEDDGSKSLEAPEVGGRRIGRGIRSSWRGDPAERNTKGKGVDKMGPQKEDGSEGSSDTSSKSKGKLVDVGLEDTLRSEMDSPQDDFLDNPPSIQQLRRSGHNPDSRFSMDTPFLPEETDEQALLDKPSPPSSSGSEVPALLNAPSEPPRHDAFWGHIFLLCQAALFASWFLIYLHTTAPDKKPLGDTVYTTLHGSFSLLATYTVVAIFVSLFWLAALRAYVRPLVYAILIAVPIILYSFSLYPFIVSFKGSWNGSSIQDRLMRWSSLAPAIVATLWIVAVIKGRHSLHKAISIQEFAIRVLGSNPGLIMVGFVHLGAFVAWTWIWISMFTRIFLGGHRSSSLPTRFIIDISTWWMAIFFVVVYLWTLSVFAGLQRSITAATVSQWYFHRLAVPTPSSHAIVQAAASHAISTLFGTVVLSGALRLLVQLPFLILPRRFTSLISLAMFQFIPTPIAALINPLSLTYASIHSQPLAASAKGLSNLHFLAPNNASTSLNPNTFSRDNAGDGWKSDVAPLRPYRLSKLLLHATRLIVSLAMGYGGWAQTARGLKLAGAGFRGSLYAYIVGLVAGAIGWGILGAMEGVLSNVVDGLVVCWGSEIGSSGRGEARYCREAGWLFGDDREGPITAEV